MKKRSLFASLLLVFALMLTACGQENPFPGTWKGTCDFSDYIVEGVVGDDETMAEYVDFDGLEITLNFEFTENEFAMSVDEASLRTFSENFEAGMIKMMENIFIAELEAAGMSYEEYVAESGMDSETLMKSLLDEMDMTTVMNELTNGLKTDLELSGTYTFDGEVLTVIYEDNTYEEMTYVFEGETLTITMSDEEISFPFVCEKQK